MAAPEPTLDERVDRPRRPARHVPRPQLTRRPRCSSSTRSLIGFLVGLRARRPAGRPGDAPVPVRLAGHRRLRRPDRPVLGAGERPDRVARAPSSTSPRPALVSSRCWPTSGSPACRSSPSGRPATSLAIVANGGYMPASAAALAALGKGPIEGYSNSAVVVDPVLAPLTDIFALPDVAPVHQRVQHRRRAHRRRHRRRDRRRDAPPAGREPAPPGLSCRGGKPAGASWNLPRIRARTGTDGSFGRGPIGPSVRIEDDERPSSKGRPGQTRREAGTQSQGSRAPSRPPGRRTEDAISETR